MHSSPPKGSGWHRYIFLAFVKMDLDVYNGSSTLVLPKPKKQSNFQIAKYIRENQLGQLLAVNFYMTTHEKNI
jgi:hypothetical protein